MSLRLYSFLRRIHKTHGRKFGTAVEVNEREQTSQVCSFRTVENNPVNHNADHIARLYTVPPDIQQQIFKYGALTKTYIDQVATFQECSILVREPAVEIISYLNQADYTRPVNKYVLLSNWFKNPKEVANSILSPGYIDLPIDAGMWLKYFKSQNSKLLSQLDLKVTKEYVWNQRESTAQDTPILELIEFGINRLKYACGVVDALIKELKMASVAGRCKTMVVIDGFNAFTSNHTRVLDDNKAMVLPKKITLALPFLDITQDDWCNGAVVLTVDEKANKERRESYLPRYLLGKEGFEHLDPFLPVLVDDYSVAEFESMMEYYKERKWIRNITPSGQREIELLTNRNPRNLMEHCKSL